MTTRHRLFVVGSSVLALLVSCADFSSNDTGSTPDGGGTNGDASSTNEVGANAEASVTDAGIDGRCAHTFCADFDDLEAGSPPNIGWTEAARDSVGSAVALIQSDVKSAPNAARFHLPNAAGTYFVFRQKTAAGAPVKDATLTFSMRPKIGEIPDGGDPLYTIGFIKLIAADGHEIGSATIDWKKTEVNVVGWVGNGGGIGDVWQRAAGTLAFDDWVTVTLVTDVSNKKVMCRIRDAQGVLLGESTVDDRNWVGDVVSVEIEIGPWSADEARPELTLTFDDVFLDVTR